MLKQLVIGIFFAFFSLTSALALAETANANIETRAVVFALNQGEAKYLLRPSNDINNSEIVADLNTVKTQNVIVKPEENNNEQSGWLLAFALIGFVMLSNRRGV
jgi:hypothetical protein